MSVKIEFEQMQKVAKGDRGAFLVIYEAHKSRVWGVCMRLMSQADRAKDAAQDTWIRVIENAHQFRPGAGLGAWIAVVARNVCINELRRDQWTEDFEDSAEDLIEVETPESILESITDRNQRVKLFEQLPAQQRVVLLMFIYEELSHAAIAQELKMSIGAVKQLIFRAKESLRRSAKEVL